VSPENTGHNSPQSKKTQTLTPGKYQVKKMPLCPVLFLNYSS
jgi:hypothetical protein